MRMYFFIFVLIAGSINPKYAQNEYVIDKYERIKEPNFGFSLSTGVPFVGHLEASVSPHPNLYFYGSLSISVGFIDFLASEERFGLGYQLPYGNNSFL